MESYQSVGKRGAFAQLCAKQLEDEGIELHPVVAKGKKIAASPWGYAWCRNIESWQDYESRLPAGRSLLRAGTVISLNVEQNLITAYVADGDLYSVRIPVDAPDPEQLNALRLRCAGNISSLIDLIRGNLSEDILQNLTDPANGLFPKHGELKFICNCLDDSCLCRHAAAALYGLGARLDDEPGLFFKMRGVDPAVFFQTAPVAEQLDDANVSLDTASLSDAFGIDLENGF